MNVLKSALKRDPLRGEILDEILDTVSSSLSLFLPHTPVFLSHFLLGVIHAPPSLHAAVFIGSVSARRPCLSSVRSRVLPSLPLFLYPSLTLHPAVGPPCCTTIALPKKVSGWEKLEICKKSENFRMSVRGHTKK